MIDFVKKTETLDYHERLIGLFLCAGLSGEWFNGILLTDRHTKRVADYGKAFRAEFEKYLRRVCNNDVNELRRRWNDPEATFEHPRIPTFDERYASYSDEIVNRRLDEFHKGESNPSNGTNVGTFLDANKYQFVADFFRAWHAGPSQAVIYFADRLKQYSPKKLIGSFYGSYGCTQFYDFGTAGCVLDMLDSGKVDFLAAPGNYEGRQPGGYIGQREMQDSFRTRNTIFIAEDDTRTHYASRYRDLMQTFTAEDSIHVMKRDFGRDICEDLLGWWFDMSGVYRSTKGNRAWFDDDELCALIDKQQKIAEHAYELDRRSNTEIAIIYDEESISYVGEQTTHEMCHIMRTNELGRIGAPCHHYFHNDFALDNMPEYKLYVFMNCFSLTNSEREAIAKRLHKDGKVALWMYAPGFINTDREKKLSAENISEITGIRIAMDPENNNPHFRLDTDDEIVAGVDRDLILGTISRPIIHSVWPLEVDAPSFLYPTFYPDDPEATILGRFLDCDHPALAAKRFKDWTSVYCPTKVIRSEVIKAVARYAGCHIYSETDDVLYANNHFVTLHASSTGIKRIRFPRKCNPVEVYENKQYGENVDFVDVEMRLGDTVMFEY